MQIWANYLVRVWDPARAMHSLANFFSRHAHQDTEIILRVQGSCP